MTNEATTPDDDRDIGALIDDLREAIAATGSLSEPDRSRLDDLVQRIETQADEDEDDDPGFFDHVDDSISRFEAEHVGLVQTINRIANALSAGGI